MVLLTPASAKMGTYIRLEVLPVVAKESVKTNHFDVAVKFLVVVVAHGAAKNVHLRTGSQQDCAPDKVGVEVILQVGETIEHLSCTLVVSHVNDLVSVLDVRFSHWLVNGVLNVANHSWQVIGSELCKRPVPVIFCVVMHAQLLMTLTVNRASVVTEPDVISGLVELNRHRSTKLWALEP